ncbi:MAG TPA: 3',5'-nucleoside bisphosphate phosphatase, partial [Burkholderiales bacterium]|nr:3',5'-nucleoside bisphosphate phosphatase [Burkholderiales bacterium]
MNADLHCHSTESDGLLSPREVVARAAANGVELLSLTDHDATSGLEDARAEAEERGLRFVDGVEISVTWRASTVHIVGLRIDPQSAALREGLESIRRGRATRAHKIAEGLAAAGIAGSLDGAQRYADNPELISRAHFARFLVEAGRAPDVKNVFQRYLVKDRPGWVPHQWASLQDAVGWIRAAGGVAVIAHPGRYQYKGLEMREFFTEFRNCGGAGIEIVTGAHTPEQYHEFARSAREFGFLASRGSDYHGKGESHADLGTLPPLPDGLKPVWHDW